MERVSVIGTTGSGKSTFSNLLAQKLDCPHIEMDQLFWKPNWTESDDSDFIERVDQAMSADSWVLDGNFSRTNRIKRRRVDTIIWIDYSYGRTLCQLLRRTFSRALTRHELWSETGNKESFKRSFFSKDSILIWFFKNYRRNRKRYLALMRSPTRESVNFFHLQSPKEVENFLASI